MAGIHPQACVDPSAELADDVEVGAFAIIEADVTIGAGSVIRPYAVLQRFTTLGEGNYVDSHATLGGPPQDIGFDPQAESYLRIGDGNTFREGVSIHRASRAGASTRIGNDTYWMANTHAAHDATIGDGVILTNNATIGAHVHLGRNVVMGGGAAVRPFCRVGERAMFQGLSVISKHLPPYCITGGRELVSGLNRVGIRRAPDITREEAMQIKEAFALLYRRNLSPADALAAMDDHEDWGPAPKRFADFIRDALQAEGPYDRGICPMAERDRQRSSDSDDDQ